MQMQKTAEKAQTTVEDARQTVRTGAAESREAAREAAAGLVERFAAGIRRQSQRAARKTEEMGDRIGSRLEGKAAEIRPEQPRSMARRVGGYLSQHPMQTLLLCGLITGLVALIALPLIGRRSSEEPEFEGYITPPRI